MKIIYVENVRIPSERAHAYQIIQTCAWFSRLGHEVVLINPYRATGKNLFDYFKLPRDLFRHITLRSWDPLSYSWFKLKGLAYVLQRWAFVRALKVWAKDQTADVWYTRDFAMVDALQNGRRRLVLELHDSPISNLDRWQRMKDAVSLYVVISRGLRDELIRLGIAEDKIHLAQDGYNPEEFLNLLTREEARAQLNLPADAFVAIYIGGFYPWKGVDLVLRAWPKTDERAHLVLIGGPDGERKRLSALIEPSVVGRVHLMPAIEHEKAVRLLPAADIGLLTTSPDFSIGRLYTSPLKQFEYLAVGLPILASDVPSSHEVLNSGVARFYPTTQEGFLSALHAIQMDVGWCKRAGERAKQLVLPYTWQERTKQIVERLNRIV
jgi:glycosyltransferase involved in cell wall biosynthesis